MAAITSDTESWNSHSFSEVEAHIKNRFQELDPYQGHEYVDFGLPSGTKWATMNVGATSATGYGNYYQYGKGVKTYQTTKTEGKYGGMETPLYLNVDTAAQTWGGLWHMPSSAQCQELLDQCTWTWGTSGGTTGYTVSKNGKSIFLPMAGFYYFATDTLYDVGSRFNIWTSTPSNTDNSYHLAAGNNDRKVDNYSRFSGFSVRPVIG